MGANDDLDDDDLDDDDLEDRPPPPTAAQIGFRICGLTGLLIRIGAERTFGREPARAQAVLAELTRWLRAQELDRHLSRVEREVIGLPLGELHPDEVFGLGWRLEAAVALLWSVGKLAAMSPYHRTSVPAEVQPLLPVFEPVEPFVMEARLRPTEELSRERRRAELWHWRARTQILERTGTAPMPGDSYGAVVRRAAEAALASGDLAGIRDGDFDCGGLAYRDLPTWADAASTAMERHHALNWVVLSADDWDLVTTHT